MKAKRVKKLDPAAPLAENAARIVRVRLSELRSFAPAALERDGRKPQHDMRIAAKRLRYALETTGFCLGASADTARRRARDLQGLLGEMHDCDVMLPRVHRHARDLRSEDAEAVRRRAGDAPDLDPRLAARAPHRTAYRGLEVLEVYLDSRRRLLFDRFRDFWGEQEQKRTWERLDRAAVDLLERARAAREAQEAAERAAREASEARGRAERTAREAERAAKAAEVRSRESRPARPARPEPKPAQRGEPDGEPRPTVTPKPRPSAPRTTPRAPG